MGAAVTLISLSACGRDGAGAGGEPVAVGCDRVAAPGGDDSGPGTEADPFGSLEALTSSLEPGQTGCLAGSEAFVADEFVIDDPGITITSVPGETAILRGRVYVQREAAGSRLNGVDIDLGGPRNFAVGVQVNAEGFELSEATITDDRDQICVSVGAVDLDFGSGNGSIIADNEILECGTPGSNFDQGIYVNGADEVLVEGNSISGAAARGLQIVGDADRNEVRGNLIYKNGQGIGLGSSHGAVPDDNVIESNVIADSDGGVNVGFNLEVDDPEPVGNVLRDNCLWVSESDTYGGIQPPPGREIPLEQTDNVVVDPQIEDGAVAGECARILYGSP